MIYKLARPCRLFHYWPGRNPFCDTYFFPQYGFCEEVLRELPRILAGIYPESLYGILPVRSGMLQRQHVQYSANCRRSDLSSGIRSVFQSVQARSSGIRSVIQFVQARSRVPDSFKLGPEFQIPHSSKIDCSLKLGCSVGGAVRDFGVSTPEIKKYFQYLFLDLVQYSGVV
jgi:hypothetical protein